MAEPEVSLKNTKAEIFEALESALQRAKAAEEGRLNPEKEEQTREEQKAVSVAQVAVKQGTIFSKELNEKFSDLQLAIATEEARLQELYGLGKELQKFSLAIEADREFRAETDAQKLKMEEEAKSFIARLQAENLKKESDLKSEYETTRKELALQRSREAEEYDYLLKRKREKENNDWEDEKRSREAELQVKEHHTQELLESAEAKIEYVRELEEKVEGFEIRVEREKVQSVAANTQALEKEFDHQTAITALESRNEISRLEDKISLLEAQLASSNKSLETVQDKLDKAYSEMRDLATKTVESVGNIKLFSNAEKNNG